MDFILQRWDIFIFQAFPVAFLLLLNQFLTCVFSESAELMHCLCYDTRQHVKPTGAVQRACVPRCASE